MKKYIEKKTITASLLLIVIIVSITSISIVLSAADNALADTGVEKRYYSANQNISARTANQDTINYTSYSVLIDSEITTPSYYNTNASLINVCGAVAGANLVGYYDTEYTNLITNYDSAIIRGGKKVFKSVSANTQNVINDLYVKMNTNATGAGVTHSQFINGLTSYINVAGYSVTIDEFVSSGQISANTIKKNIENGIPMVCFCTMSYFINNISIGSNVTTLTKVDYQANHIMVVNGIKQVAYFQNGENFRTDTYLKVAVGLQENVSAYILLSSIVLDNMNTLAIK